MTIDQDKVPEGATSDAPHPDRRQVLDSVARWTPPALMTLLLSSRASASSLLPDSGFNNDPTPGPPP